MSSRKPRSDSKLKLLPQEMQQAIYDMAMKPGTSVLDACKYIAAEYDISVAASTLSEYLSWFGLKATYEQATRFAQDMEKALAESDPSMSPEKVRRFGQAVFMQRAIAKGDFKEFSGLSRLDLSREALEHNIDKHNTLKAKKIELGVTALFEELKLQPEKLAALRELLADVFK